MPSRTVPFVNDHYYHILNRGTNGLPLFKSKVSMHLFAKICDYYTVEEPPLRYSYFHRLKLEDRVAYSRNISAKPELVEILAYCIMPNHFHFLVKQHIDQGISLWMRKSLNSFSSWYNLTHKRKGTLFQHVFKSVHISSDEQLLHTARYIHLNPYVAGIVNIEKLISYPGSSLGEYLAESTSQHIQIKTSQHYLLDNFKTRDDFRSFTFDQADYARKLKAFEYLDLE